MSLPINKLIKKKKKKINTNWIYNNNNIEFEQKLITMESISYTSNTIYRYDRTNDNQYSSGSYININGSIRIIKTNNNVNVDQDYNAINGNFNDLIHIDPI